MFVRFNLCSFPFRGKPLVYWKFTVVFYVQKIHFISYFLSTLCLSVNNIIKVTTVYDLVLTAVTKVHFKEENTITVFKHVYIKIN